MCEAVAKTGENTAAPYSPNNQLTKNEAFVGNTH